MSRTWNLIRKWKIKGKKSNQLMAEYDTLENVYPPSSIGLQMPSRVLRERASTRLPLLKWILHSKPTRRIKKGAGKKKVHID